jgi:hypothetical protein
MQIGTPSSLHRRDHSIRGQAPPARSRYPCPATTIESTQPFGHPSSRPGAVCCESSPFRTGRQRQRPRPLGRRARDTPTGRRTILAMRCRIMPFLDQARRLRRHGPCVSAFPLALAAPVGARRATPQEPGRSTRPSSRTRRMPAPTSSLPAGVRSPSPRPRWARTTIRPGTAECPHLRLRPWAAAESVTASTCYPVRPA